jgi:4-amino-4-deoxy-L-arabinose transferase-like glycosyltransferase
MDPEPRTTITDAAAARTAAAAWRSRSRWMVPALLLLSGVLYVGTAGTPALVDDDIDAAHALVAREMLQRHDWVIPYQDGIRYLIRPPLHFWLVAASYTVLGETAFATRLPVALAMVGLVLLTFIFGRRFFGERSGFYAALAVATSPGMFLFTRTVIPEAIYALEFTAIFYLFLRSWTRSLDPRIGCRAAAAVCGLAALTRGPIGVLFPAAAIALFLTATGSWRRWKELQLPSSAAVFLAVAVPWHVLAELRAPGFAWAYFVNEHVLRALGTREPKDYGAVPLGLWLLEHVVWLFPWSLFAPALVQLFPRPSTWRRANDPDTAARLMLFLWAGVIVVFFMIESGSRMEYYSFGAWPALALLLGHGLDSAERSGRRWVRGVAGALAAFGVIYAALATAAVAAFGRNRGDIVAHLQTKDATAYQTALARLTDLTPQALADLRMPLLVSAGALLVAFVSAWVLRRHGRPLAATCAMASGMAGLFLAANLAYAGLEPSFSSVGLARQLDGLLQPGDRVAFYGDIRVAPGVAFYCGRRVLLWDASVTNLLYGSRYPDAPKTLYDDLEFSALWTGPGRVVLVVPSNESGEALAKLPPASSRVLASAGGKTAYVNRAS